jgi:hypothetical protein
MPSDDQKIIRSGSLLFFDAIDPLWPLYKALHNGHYVHVQLRSQSRVLPEL